MCFVNNRKTQIEKYFQFFLQTKTAAIFTRHKCFFDYLNGIKKSPQKTTFKREFFVFINGYISFCRRFYVRRTDFNKHPPAFCAFLLSGSSSAAFCVYAVDFFFYNLAESLFVYFYALRGCDRFIGKRIEHDLLFFKHIHKFFVNRVFA